MNINIRKIGALLLLLFSIFTLAACQNITEEVTVESIQVEISTLNPNYNVDDFDLSTISIRVAFSDGKFQIIPITESMLTEEHLSLLSNVGEHQITITYQGKSTTINLNLQYDSLKTQLMTLYTLSTTSGSFSGTYEEWLETVRGPQGNPGREVLFQVAEGYIEWQYTGDTTWTNLVELTSLVGPAGADGVDGTDGKQVTFQVSEGFIQWQYVGDTTWTNLIDLQTITGADGSNGTDGTDGREVLFQVAEGYIQWQYTGDTTWTNLVELTSLVGPAGQDGVDGINGKQVTFQVSEGFIQWQYVGDTTWTNLIDLQTITGADGSNGTDGVDGREVLFQVAGGYIQWQYTGDLTWNNLIDLATITGANGTNGTDGVDGREVLFQVSEGYIQWQYTGDLTWTNLIDVETIAGVDGLTPYIGDNGNWFIGELDTNVIADFSALPYEATEGLIFASLVINQTEQYAIIGFLGTPDSSGPAINGGGSWAETVWVPSTFKNYQIYGIVVEKPIFSFLTYYYPSAVVGDGIEYLSSYSLHNLHRVLLPKSIKIISASTFNDTLLEIYYEGTQFEFEQIQKGDNWSPVDVVIYYYSSSQPIFPGNYWFYNSEGEIEIW